MRESQGFPSTQGVDIMRRASVSIHGGAVDPLAGSRMRVSLQGLSVNSAGSRFSAVTPYGAQPLPSATAGVATMNSASSPLAGRHPLAFGNGNNALSNSFAPVRTQGSMYDDRVVAPSSQASNDSVQVISLGCACGPKMAFQDMGMGAATLPFDWVTTTAEGVMDFLRTGFKGFFDFDRKVEKNVQGHNITAFRSRRHGFWHDDPTQQSTREKYQRRIARLMATDARTQPVLFVRLAATSDELRTADVFAKTLQSQFGPRAMLLLIIDCQPANAPGACTVAGIDNLLIHYLPGASGTDKFCGPIRNAVDWAANRPSQCKQLGNMAAAIGTASPVTPGFYGMGGIPAFEGIPEMC